MVAAHSIQYVEDDSHRNAELLKVQVAIVVDVGQIPDPFQLVVPQPAVLQHGCSLLAGQELGAAGPRREDVPVCLYLLCFDLGRHRGDRADRGGPVKSIDFFGGQRASTMGTTKKIKHIRSEKRQAST